jgi:hypothetical protein
VHIACPHMPYKDLYSIDKQLLMIRAETNGTGSELGIIIIPKQRVKLAPTAPRPPPPPPPRHLRHPPQTATFPSP